MTPQEQKLVKLAKRKQRNLIRREKFAISDTGKHHRKPYPLENNVNTTISNVKWVN